MRGYDLRTKRKAIIKKVLPVGLAMGVLFGSNLITPENKAHAYGSEILQIGANIYSAFLEKPLGEALALQGAKTTYNSTNENFAYVAPNFNKGQFAISVFDYYKNKDFSKTVKIYYDDTRFGYKVEEKTIKHGEQLIITEPRTIVAFYPDENNKSKREVFMVTQEHLNTGNTGVALTNFQNYYLKKRSSGEINYQPAEAALRKSTGTSQHTLSVKQVEDNFKLLSADQQRQLTMTTNPIKKDVFEAEMNSEDKGYMKQYIDSGGLDWTPSVQVTNQPLAGNQFEWVMKTVASKPVEFARLKLNTSTKEMEINYKAGKSESAQIRVLSSGKEIYKKFLKKGDQIKAETQKISVKVGDYIWVTHDFGEVEEVFTLTNVGNKMQTKLGQGLVFQVTSEGLKKVPFYEYFDKLLK